MNGFPGLPPVVINLLLFRVRLSFHDIFPDASENKPKSLLALCLKMSP